MLILIVGITGALGGHLAESAFARKHTVRGLGRSPKSLAPNIAARLESFVELQSYDDRTAIDKACCGVDAVICALRSVPELELDAQLLLLRAAERAGIKIFVSSTWNNDWTKMRLGDFEHYDAHISFRRQAELSSPISPVYLFVGVFAEYLFEFTCFPPRDNEDGSGKEITYWDSPHMKIDWTSMPDAAEFTLEVLDDEGVKQGNGGCFSFRSGETTVQELADTYGRVTGVKMEFVRGGSEDELEALALKHRSTSDVKDYFSYAIYLFHLFTVKRVWRLENLWDSPKIQRTTLEEAVAAKV
ncbi:hypothetical protein V500_11618 [Pseudogymnoascus sp. VKM F-4518 (FW-2643)]|nr:hypothetical protein V500_11618 [Pseudogymnoascus sp. VKM F-4518 (FW-2643)]